MGIINPITKTVKTVLMAVIFNPSPIGNIWIKGANMTNMGIINTENNITCLF